MSAICFVRYVVSLIVCHNHYISSFMLNLCYRNKYLTVITYGNVNPPSQLRDFLPVYLAGIIVLVVIRDM